jgi:hypothetical protein
MKMPSGNFGYRGLAQQTLSLVWRGGSEKIPLMSPQLRKRDKHTCNAKLGARIL